MKTDTDYKSHFQIVSLHKVLQFYANEFDAPLRKTTLTDDVDFDAWIDHDQVVFRVWVEKDD